MFSPLHLSLLLSNYGFFSEIYLYTNHWNIMFLSLAIPDIWCMGVIYLSSRFWNQFLLSTLRLVIVYLVTLNFVVTTCYYPFILVFPFLYWWQINTCKGVYIKYVGGGTGGFYKFFKKSLIAQETMDLNISWTSIFFEKYVMDPPINFSFLFKVYL